MNAVQQLSDQQVAVSVACDVLGVPRSNFYRAKQPKRVRKPRSTPERALSQQEQDHVLKVLNGERFDEIRTDFIRTRLPVRSMPPCSMKALTSVPGGPCTASSKQTTK